MDSNNAIEVAGKIQEIQTLMIAYVTNGRTHEQPQSYKQLYDEVYIDLEESKYSNPNPHKSLETLHWIHQSQFFRSEPGQTA